MNAFKDLFDKKILKYTILPFFIDLIFWFIVYLFFSDKIISFFVNLLGYFPFTDKISQSIGNIGGILLTVLFYYISVISTLGIFTSFFIDKIVLRINEKYFNLSYKNASFKDTLKGVYVSLKSFLVFILIFIFTFYLIFVPVVNIFYQIFMLSVLNKKPLVFDSSYLFINPKKIEEKFNVKIWLLVITTSVIYLIPIISLFGYTFQLIFIAHFVLKKIKENNDLQSRSA